MICAADGSLPSLFRLSAYILLLLLEHLRTIPSPGSLALGWLALARNMPMDTLWYD